MGVDMLFEAGVVLGLIYAVLVGARMLASRRPDGLIDDLIANNSAHPIPGMERPDVEIMRRKAELAWQQVLGERTRETVKVLRGPTCR